ncbi:response regulator transcription factor [Arcobacter cryaerophilus gv. pseudocryaerophilus]|uniref:Response regulator transcription factor n=3 Tax=Arcobacteraceae TaxID=2808963 RepID=A0AA96DT77_9BACT|nr:response regulator transcription factor [Arcobacter sp. AZ-2023]WNL36750.1 response regulator transcription factor [Arcobacter sp. AZ-2023]WPD12466.1 response regulator transcription factor [Arcobacter sp. DSM 115960]
MDNIDLLKNLNLLLVEDDQELRSSIKETLSIFFKNVFTANNGLEAIDTYSNKSIDLIITDYVMPTMNGYELCKKIREINRKIPLVIMSNYTDQEKLLKSISLELTDYIIKPIEYKQLLATLIKMVEKLERENLLSFNITTNKKYNFFTKEIYDEKEKQHIKLTKSEVIILELLINNLDKVLTIENIEYSLSPLEHKSEQAIKNVIHRLRSKLPKNLLSNIKGIGYKLKKEA